MWTAFSHLGNGQEKEKEKEKITSQFYEQKTGLYNS